MALRYCGQVLRDGFDSRLEPITYDICNKWLVARKAQAQFAVFLSITVKFSVQYDLKIILVIIWFDLSRVKPMNLKLVFTSSLLDAQH